MNFKKIVLKNGLRIILAPNKESLSVTAMVAVEAGSKYESEKLNGISHFLEHMCFKGTKKRPKSIDISKELDGIGAESNAFTSHEYTAYYAKAAYRHFNKIIDIISDVYINSTFPEKEIEKEKGVIIEEINMYEDIPRIDVQYLFQNLLYKDQPAGRSILGSKNSVKSIKRKDFLKYKSDHYVSKGTIVLISGNFNEKEAISLVKNNFKDLINKKKVNKKKVKDIQVKPKIAFKKKKTDQTNIVLGFRSLPAYKKENADLEVMSAILGEGMSSRLFQRLREEMGASYYIRSSNDPFTDHGIFAVSAGIDKKRVKELVEVILKEFCDLKDNLVNNDEIEKAKEYIIGNLYLSLETNSDVASFCLLEEVLRGKTFSPEDWVKEIRKVTPESLIKTAKKIFLNKNLNLAIISEKADIKTLEKILKI